MDEYADVYFVEGGRNADHRTGAQQGGGGFRAVPGRTIVAQPQRAYPAAQQPMVYAQPAIGVGIGGSLFGRMTTGQVIDLVAQIFAALMPLPAAPVSTSEANTDVGNLILYQSSLAQYAKRDEQVRTLGNLVTKLVG